MALLKRRGTGRAKPSFNRRALLTAAAMVTALAVLLWCYNSKIDPLVEQAAIYAVTDEVSLIVNDVVEKQIQSGRLDYDKLVTVEKDGQGNIVALITNVANTNLLQTGITTQVIKGITDNFLTDLKIPAGNVIGGSLLYGRGPLIPVRLKSVTNVNAEFENTFSSAGINQTRHQIKLNVSVQVLVMIPGREIVSPVNTTVVIAETVIVGKVPDTYASIG
ncbi:MAG: sporulation protein YunB [Oscillospiraceae bacterium]|nr:sporulation protein YunB [Oscillospiraceae bacterium]